MQELPDIGRNIREHLSARGMNQNDLYEFLNRPMREINEIIAGVRDIDPATAEGLARAFGTTARYWLEQQMALDMYQTMRDD